MERRCVGLALAVSFLTGASVAQTPEEITDAIERLDGPREDARAIEFLIDAGERAVGPIVEELQAGPEHLSDTKLARMLQVLRASRANAPIAYPVMSELLMNDRLVEPRLERFVAVVDTAASLAPFVGERPRPGDMLGLHNRIFQVMVQTKRGGFEARVMRLLRRLEMASLDTTHPARTALLDGRDIFEREMAADLFQCTDRDALAALEATLADDSQPGDSCFPRETQTSQLRMRQEDANRIVWDAASKAIARIDPDHPKAIRGLALMVESADDPRDRLEAAASLGRHGAAAMDHVDVLVAALDSDDDRLVAEAVTALGMIGVASDAVLERLRALTEDSRPAIAERAKAALRALEKRNR